LFPASALSSPSLRRTLVLLIFYSALAYYQQQLVDNNFCITLRLRGFIFLSTGNGLKTQKVVKKLKRLFFKIMLMLLRFEGNKNTVYAAKSVIFAHLRFHAKSQRRYE